MKDEKKSREQLSKEMNDLRTLNRELGVQKKELLESNQFLENVFQTSGDGILVIDDKGCIIRANKSMENILDYPYADIVGKYTFDFASVDEESAKKNKGVLEDFYEKGFVKNFESNFQKKGGTLVPIEINITKLLDKQGNYIGAVSSLRDISERKRSEMRLQESEEKYRELVENANSIIMRRLPDGTITFFNEFAQKFFGFDASEIIGKNVIGSIVPEKESAGRDLKQMIADIFKNTAKYEQHENENICKDGKRVWVNWTNRAIQDQNGNVIEVLSVGTDITERKQAEEETKSAKLFIDRVVDMSPIIMWISDQRGTVIRTNSTLRKIFNLTDDRIVGKYNVLKDLNLKTQGVMPMVMSVFENQEPTHFCIPWKATKAGVANFESAREIYIDVSIFPIINAEGKLTNVVCQAVDITEHKQLEDNLRQSQKMESVGTLAGGIAHEFNNILGGIIGYTEIAKEDASEDSSVRESLDEILKLSIRARDVVSQILSFSRKGAKVSESLQPSFGIKETLKILRSTIPTSIEFKHNIDEKAGTIMADSTQLHQVGMNLCINAAHAMEETGGVLEVGFSSVVLDAEDLKPYPDLKTGEYVKLTVSDTGAGIDPNNIDKIFDPFFTTKEVGKGTGMGLSIVHGIIKDHGGVINVSSKLGEGTTFTVFLPKTEVKINKTESDDALPTGTEDILVVDDEEHLVFLMKTILGRLGYKVTALTNSLEALNLFKKDPQRYDLIITDLTMPHLTGDKLASEVIAIRPDMPVIISTGYADAVDSEKVKQSGIKAFIPKPCQKQDLAKTIRLILDGK